MATAQELGLSVGDKVRMPDIGNLSTSDMLVRCVTDAFNAVSEGREPQRIEIMRIGEIPTLPIEVVGYTGGYGTVTFRCLADANSGWSHEGDERVIPNSVYAGYMREEWFDAIEPHLDPQP